jgi:hypothetical protein
MWRRDGSKAVHGAIIGGSQPFRIGGGAPAGEATYYFEGLIDEAALYDRALSAEEVAAQYRAGWHGKCAVPVYCSMPSAPVLMGLSGPVAQVAWDACGEADRYALFYRPAGAPDFQGLITFDTTAAFVVEPGLSYEVLVKARCAGANGPASDTLVFSVPTTRDAQIPFLLYPNPSNGTVFIRGSQSSLITRVVVMDALGRRAYEVLDQGGILSLNLGGLPAGTYRVQLWTDEAVSVHALLLQ